MSGDDVREYRIRGSLGSRAFYGELLHSVSTETPQRPRWLELALYRNWEVERDAEGQPVSPLRPVSPKGYVLHTVGRSLVYHAHGSTCRKGSALNEKRLAGDAEPCEECTPPALDDLEPGTVVDAEVDRHAVHNCATWEQVIAELQDPKLAGAESLAMDRLSTPARALLTGAAERDADIAAAIEVTQWLLAGTARHRV